jgi:hypothetical protein
MTDAVNALLTECVHGKNVVYQQELAIGHVLNVRDKKY